MFLYWVLRDRVDVVCTTMMPAYGGEASKPLVALLRAGLPVCCCRNCSSRDEAFSIFVIFAGTIELFARLLPR